MPRNLTESSVSPLCGRKSDVEQVAEADMLKRDHPKFKRQLNFGNQGASKSECRETHRVKAFRRLRKKVLISIHAQRDHPKFKRQLNFGNRGNRSRNAAKLTESKRFAVCGRKSDVEQVAEAYMLKRDHRNSKATEFRQPGIEVGMPRNSPSQSVSPFAGRKSDGHRSRNAAKLTESKRFAVLRKKVCVEQVAEARHAQEGSPEIQRQLNFGKGHRSRNAAKLTESKRFAVCGRKSDVEQVAEAYMLKRDHRNSKATEFRQPGHRSRNAAKLTESKRFAVCGRKSDVEQVAEAYMLKRDHPKFKGN
ncbi:hypothetical protein D5086_021146 [Populus alba]|uniref:Uncharacterized protein n=1 Tax=Populus alba TaxID=43335 RepID=A0ACC4BBA2_POPAL